MNKLSDSISRRGDFWWPTLDRGCWNYMNQYPDVPKSLSEHVTEKGVVVQAGGNAGFYIRQYAELFDVVYTFEPEPVNFLCLTMNCDTPNVIKFQACVGENTGFVSLAHKPSDVGATHVGGHGILPTMKIDDLGLERCDLIQLDTEGFEYFGLLGAENTIDKFKPVLSIEWYAPWAARYDVTLSILEEFLDKWDYKMIAQYATDRVYAVQS
jgi:FkbM family methyltransferase